MSISESVHMAHMATWKNLNSQTNFFQLCICQTTNNQDTDNIYNPYLHQVYPVEICNNVIALLLYFFMAGLNIWIYFKCRIL